MAIGVSPLGMKKTLLGLLVAFGSLAGNLHADTPAPPPALAGDAVSVALTGGYNTDPRDRGRPVIMVAAALNVPSDVFRETFTHVHPAPAGQEPDPEQVRKNKQALMEGLSPYGVTDDRLNEVSNYYRYRRDRDKLWRHTPATVVALVQNGAVVGFKITDTGSGYSSPPEVTVPGFKDLKVKVTLAFGTDLKTNGSIQSIALDTGDIRP
jgi:hypothetical protein